MPRQGAFGSPAYAQRQRAEELAALCGLVTHEGEWFGAVELAERLGLPWRPLAFALRRLADRGIVQERIEAYSSEHRTKEQTRLYRFGDAAVRNPFVPRIVPRIVPLRPGVARRVRGRGWVDEERV